MPSESPTPKEQHAPQSPAVEDGRSSVEPAPALNGKGTAKSDDVEDSGSSSEAPEAKAKLLDESSKPKEKSDDNNQPEEPAEDGSASPNDESGRATSTQQSDATVPAQNDWQAIWAPPYNAYYFYNSKTGITTWENPLQQAPPEPSTSAQPSQPPAPSAVPAYSTEPEVPEHLLGIDPLLRHLDQGTPYGGPTGEYAASARFNRHTGRFEADPTKNPERMSEFERAKRMSEVYFDVGAWEKEVEERKEREREEGLGKRKRPTQKDLERYKESKKRKKIAKTAWLRN